MPKFINKFDDIDIIDPANNIDIIFFIFDEGPEAEG